jgi:hypothetical protein
MKVCSVAMMWGSSVYLKVITGYIYGVMVAIHEVLSEENIAFDFEGSRVLKTRKIM